jgi:hypothetical protein
MMPAARLAAVLDPFQRFQGVCPKHGPTQPVVEIQQLARRA